MERLGAWTAHLLLTVKEAGGKHAKYCPGPGQHQDPPEFVVVGSNSRGTEWERGEGGLVCVYDTVLPGHPLQRPKRARQ